MRQQRVRKARSLLTPIAVVLALAAGAAPLRADDTPAHALAQKFAGPAAEVEAAARLEADRRALDAKKKAAEKSREEAVKRAAEARRKAEDAHRAALQQKADEVEMLAAARAEQAERDAEVRRAQILLDAVERERQASEALREAEAVRHQAEADARAAAAARHDAEALRAAAEAASKSEAARAELAQRKAESDRLAQEAERRATAEAEQRAAAEARDMAAMQEQREREGRELVAKLKAMRDRLALARASRLAREAAATPIPADPVPVAPPTERRDEAAAAPARTEPPPAPERAEAKPPAVPQPVAGITETHATILLVVEHGNRGVRFDKFADPILCIRDRCYIGAGAGHAAVSLTRTNALGPVNTMMFKAGACNRRLGCVFRNVAFDWDTVAIQPVDLRFFGHDRRQPAEARLDASCVMDSGRLHCDHPVASEGWRAWIVPESVAARVGPEALQIAVERGLPVTREALNAGR